MLVDLLHVQADTPCDTAFTACVITSKISCIGVFLLQGYELPDFLGPQFIMAKRNSRFLQHWYRGYERHYKKNSWNYNSMRLPALLADKYPDIIHTEGYRFVQPNARNRHLIFDENYNWSDNYAIHLYIRYYKNFTDEYVIRNLNTTLGAVARHVLYGNKELCM